MPYIKIDNLRTYYEVNGTGEVVVLLHNGFSCCKMWAQVAERFIQAGFRVLMYDRRGYGQSQGGPDFEDHYISNGFREAAVGAMDALVAALGIDAFHIVGQCEGGVVGVDYAVRFPQKVKTLTTASTLCYSEIPLEDFNRLKFPKTFYDLPHDIQMKYVYWHGPERAKAFYELCSRYGGCYGRDLFDLRPELQRVGCPVLVMYPDRGHFFEAEQGVAFFRSLGKGELAIFPKCGHNIFEHYPDLYAETAIAFIARNTA